MSLGRRRPFILFSGITIIVLSGMLYIASIDTVPNLIRKMLASLGAIFLDEGYQTLK